MTSAVVQRATPREPAHPASPRRRRRRRELVLAAVYVIIAAFYVAHSLPRATPFGFLDELIYGRLAQNLGFGEGLTYQGLTVTAYKTLYPFVIAPAWALFSDHDRAYDAALLINALLMSSVLFPAYAIARRVASFPWAVTAGAAAALTPAMAWASMLMTESLAYPLAALSLWATTIAVARPGPRTALIAVAAACLAATARSHALVLLAVFALAVVIDIARFGRDWRERAAAHRVSLLAIGAGLLAGIAVLALGLLGSVVGTYGGQNRSYGLGDVLAYAPQHLPLLAVSTLLVPLVALLALAADRRWWRDPAVGPVLVVGVAAVIGFVAVAAWATASLGPPVRERYVFYPTAVLVALWVGLWGRASLRAFAVATGVLVVWLAAVIPGTFPQEAAGEWATYTLGRVGSFALPRIAPHLQIHLGISIPYEVPGWLGGDLPLWPIALLGAGALTYWALRRGPTPASVAAFAVPPLLFGALVVSMRNHDLGAQSQMQFGLRMQPPDAIDRVTRGEPAAFVRTSSATEPPDLWHLELWNRSLDRAWRIADVEPRAQVGQECELSMSPRGVLRPSRAWRARADDPRRPCAGRPLARFLVFTDPTHDERVLNGRLRLRSNDTTVWELRPGVAPKVQLTPADR